MAEPITDKEYKRERKRVRALMDKWRDPLRLYDWDISLLYTRGPFPVDGEWRQRTAIGVCTTDWQYRRASLTFDTEATRDLDDAKLERVFVHECCHVLLNEMRQWKDADDARDHEERVAETLAWILVGMAEAKQCHSG